MTRCSAQDSQNRVCLLPSDHRGKHAVAASNFTLEAANRILDRWGYTSPDVRAAVALRFAAGEVSAERFMAVLKLAVALRTGIFGDDGD